MSEKTLKFKIMEAINENGEVVVSHPGYREGLISEIRLLSLLTLVVLITDLLIRNL